MKQRISTKKPNSWVSKHFWLVFLLLVSSFFTNNYAQESYVKTHEDSIALEHIIVEKYHIADSLDFADTLGGAVPYGAITYRIYVDLRPDYTLQMVFGTEKHPLEIRTSTVFYNNLYCMGITGLNIPDQEINDNNVALDSWITINAATRHKVGVLKSEDKDGSIIRRGELSQVDGLTGGNLPMFKPYKLDLDFFKNSTKASVLYTKDGAWAALGGVKGPTLENKILIAQLTTNGHLSFKINLQIGTPQKAWIYFVASSKTSYEVNHKELTYP